ncbi:MAG: hypothetical protein ACO1OO_10670 [Flavisolibacter sp.]
MKKILGIVAIAGALVACNNTADETTTTDTTTTTTVEPVAPVTPDTTVTVVDSTAVDTTVQQ